ncbi:ribulose-phosphate 3-epimerase [Acholeplasma granularum]|uniref:ribulose-phosphate 3-epimerase n=1 Tax=Acholeplasma granularum TaxID=264635 RepID=UPI00047207C4|nr:ribulose-phosphate 3-epimerase [Acholeplasma granularum]
MKVAPSILTANFIRLEDELKSVEKGSDYIHVDVMDGHFVPNISFGPAIVSQIGDLTSLPMDIHLMVEFPLDWIDKVIFPTTEFITIHAECNRFKESIRRILYLGKKAGIAIKPNTPVDVIKPYLDQLDLVLVMGVEPGYGGQVFIQSQLDKIRELAELKKENNYRYEIQVDGGINQSTAKQVKDAGATIVVAGTYIFNYQDREERIQSLK